MVEKAVKHLSVFQLLTILAVNFLVDILDASTLTTVFLKISYRLMEEVAYALEERNELNAHAYRKITF